MTVNCLNDPLTLTLIFLSKLLHESSEPWLTSELAAYIRIWNVAVQWLIFDKHLLFLHFQHFRLLSFNVCLRLCLHLKRRQAGARQFTVLCSVLKNTLKVTTVRNNWDSTKISLCKQFLRCSYRCKECCQHLVFLLIFKKAY